jgi:hypothetical protein
MQAQPWHEGCCWSVSHWQLGWHLAAPQRPLLGVAASRSCGCVWVALAHLPMHIMCAVMLSRKHQCPTSLAVISCTEAHMRCTHALPPCMLVQNVRPVLSEGHNTTSVHNARGTEAGCCDACNAVSATLHTDNESPFDHHVQSVSISMHHHWLTTGWMTHATRMQRLELLVGAHCTMRACGGCLHKRLPHWPMHTHSEHSRCTLLYFTTKRMQAGSSGCDAFFTGPDHMLCVLFPAGSVAGTEPSANHSSGFRGPAPPPAPPGPNPHNPGGSLDQTLVVLSQAEADAYGAKCLDGSPPAMYYSPARGEDNANNWVRACVQYNCSL